MSSEQLYISFFTSSGISLGNLAGNVALNGGMGVISTAQPGYRAADFEKNTVEANRRELASEIQKAKEIAKGRNYWLA